MRLFHYLEIENFKRFGEVQRIELEHPAVIIGPNNCGKTSAIQSIALWSQAVKSWYATRKESTAKERPATSLNRLAIVSVPVQKTRYFWHNTRVHTGRESIPLSITIGLHWKGQVVPVKMRFRHQGDELVYCQPEEIIMEQRELIEFAASISVELLYPMSGLATEEPILKPGRVSVLLGQGETAQVLRNLCLAVAKDNPEDWLRIAGLMRRLFAADLDLPSENVRGSVDLQYRQVGVKEPLDISMAGRGFQQLLLIFSYLFSHKGSVLLVDEPDAHLEILRQKQVYILLRDIADENKSQVIMVTHSEVILDEALDNNLTLLLEGRADDLAAKGTIRNTLKHYGAEHYVKARERGYVLYVEGSTDIDMLRALGARLGHQIAEIWDDRVNSYYVQDNYPSASLSSEMERVEGGFGGTPKDHFFALRQLLPDLRGLAILDNDGKGRTDFEEGGLVVKYWRRYEAENYFITPDLLEGYVVGQYGDMTLFDSFRRDARDVLDVLIRERVFAGIAADFKVYRGLPPDAARVLWEAKTERIKLSDFAEEFFRRLAAKLGQRMLLRKGELHQLVAYADPQAIPNEVREKLDLLIDVFRPAAKHVELEGEEGAL